jgi:hypothetical protein
LEEAQLVILLQSLRRASVRVVQLIYISDTIEEL